MLALVDKKFDLIVGDAFSDIAVPAHLVTREFFELVRNRLHKEGAFLMNVVDYSDSLHVLAAVVRTMESIFPSVEIWTRADPPQAGERRNFVLVAGVRDTSLSSIVAPAPDQLEFAALHPSFKEQVLRPLGTFLLTDDYVPINYLLMKGPADP